MTVENRFEELAKVEQFETLNFSTVVQQHFVCIGGDHTITKGEGFQIKL